MLLDAEACYAAVERRDRRFDGRFLTGVLTTGVYCRPSCPARTPKRANVRFFACPAAAEEAGLRACRRCRPEIAPTAPDWDLDSHLARRAVRLIDEGVVDTDGVEGLARRLHVSSRHLGRVLQRELGAGPVALARARRARLARQLVDGTDLPLSTIAFASGYGSIRRFNDEARRAFGCAPSELRRSVPGPTGADAMAGDPAVALRLLVRRPFDGDALLAFLGRRAVAGVEQVDGRTYRRTFDGGVLEATVDEEAVRLRLLGVELRAVPSAVAAVRRVLDVDADPLAAIDVLSADPAIAPLVARRPGLRVPGAVDGFELAVRAVLGQQVSVAAARTLAGRLVALAGELLAPRAGGLTHRFPTAAAVAAAPLDRLGAPARRLASLRALAVAVRDGAVDLAPGGDTAEATAALRRIAGIGPWTAGYVALRAFRDPDAWPAGDVGLREALARRLGRAVTAKELDARAERWRPWRAVAALHLWTSLAEPVGTASEPVA